jgi:microcystin-dependent protein
MNPISKNTELPVGTILVSPETQPPDGFLSCDGSQVSRTQYARLFACVGTIHGSGDGSTTFNLPDYRVDQKPTRYVVKF